MKFIFDTLSITHASYAFFILLFYYLSGGRCKNEIFLEKTPYMKFLSASYLSSGHYKNTKFEKNNTLHENF
jgi:hypothetical protein